MILIIIHYLLAYIKIVVLTVNRRLDEWVRLEQLDLDSVENDVDEKVEDKVLFLIIIIDSYALKF